MVNFRSQCTPAAGKLHCKDARPAFFEYLSLVLYCSSILCTRDMPGYSISIPHTCPCLWFPPPHSWPQVPVGNWGRAAQFDAWQNSRRGLMSRERGWTLTPAPLFHLDFPRWYKALQIMYGCRWISWQGLCGPTVPNQEYRRDANCQGMKSLFTRKKKQKKKTGHFKIFNTPRGKLLFHVLWWIMKTLYL